MTGEEDSEVLSLNLSSTTNSNISFNNQNPTATSTSSVIGIVSKRDEKIDNNGQGLVGSEDGKYNDSKVKGHSESLVLSNHSETRVKSDDDHDGFASEEDFEDDDEDAMQIDLSRTAESPDDVHDQDGRESVNNFSSSGEQDVSAICTSTSGGSVVNTVDHQVNSTTISSSFRSNTSPLLPLPSHSGIIGAGNNCAGGRTPGQISRSDSQSQDFTYDPDLILSSDDILSLPQEKFSQAYAQLGDSYRHLHLRLQDSVDEIVQLKEAVQRSQHQVSDATRRENVLVMRLSSKEQETQDYVAQINDLKTAIAPTSGSLRSTLLDPAVNLIILKMKKELDETKKKLEDTQNDLNAWKFTPDSNTGKRLMAKCRMLYQENEELGKMISSGRLAKLESDLALQKSLTEEMKKSQSELDELVQELDEDVEGMQSTVCFYQQQLRDIKQSANSNTNPSNSVSETEFVSVNVAELCAQCRAIQEKKKLQEEQQSQFLENSNSAALPSQLKLDKTSPHSSPSSSCEPLITQTRTWVNGEVDDSIESDRKPLGLNLKVNHLMSCKLESTKSNFNHDDTLTNDANVEKDSNSESTGGSVANSVQINQSVKVKKEIEDSKEMSLIRQKRKFPSRGDLSNYEPETPNFKRTKRTYASSLQVSTPNTGSSPINSNVVVNSSNSVSVRTTAGETVPFPSSSSSSFNNPTTANGNGSLEEH